MNANALSRVVAAMALQLVTSCTYGPPQYRGTIDHAVLLADGRVALAYHQWIGRPPTGISTFPDGGSPKTLHDVSLVALVAADGSTREVTRIDNLGLGEEAHLALAWYKTDLDHLYVTRTGYDQTHDRFREQFRIDLQGRKERSYDLVAELAKRGRSFGSKQFGGARVVSPDGTMLVGATYSNGQELWLRNAEGTLSLLDRFDSFGALLNDELVYTKDDVTLARNWRTGAVRPIRRFDRSARRSEQLVPDTDPVIYQLRHREIEPNDQVWPSAGKKLLRVYHNNELVREVRPDPRVVDRI